MPYVNLNGKLVGAQDSGIPMDNRAFRYGYGLFETMLYRNDEIELSGYHWERLFAGMKQLAFEVHKHFTPQLLQTEVKRTAHRNGLEALCRIRLQVWPGNGGLYDATSLAPQFLIECFPLSPDLITINENGLSIGIAQGLQKSMDSLANLKSCNSLIYAMAAAQAKQQKWNDALICNTSGNIVESTIANVFWVKDRHFYTPPLSEGCVNGVMRRHLLHKLDAKKIPFIEIPLSVRLLELADEVFLTNAIRKIKWVKDFNGISYRCEQSQLIARSL